MSVQGLYDSLYGMRDKRVQLEKAYRKGFALQSWRFEKWLWQSPTLRFIFFRLLSPFTLPQYRLAKAHIWQSMVDIFLAVFRPHVMALAHVPESERYIARACYTNDALKSIATALAKSPFQVHTDIDAVTGRIQDPQEEHLSRVVVMDVELAELLYYGECLRLAVNERVELLQIWTNAKEAAPSPQIL